jgi:hypothetical protein
MPCMTNDALIGASEAAREAGVSVDVIKRAARTGALPHAMKAPGKTGAYLFTREAVQAYAQQRAA